MNDQYPSPSRYLLRFFQWICRSDRFDEIVGDLLEVYEEDKLVMPAWKARSRFMVGLLFFFRLRNLAAYHTHVNFMLISNYCHVGWRNLKKHKTYSALNVFGLTVGLVSSLFVLLYVLEELRFDKHFANHDRIYRVALAGEMQDSEITSASSCLPAGWRMKEELADVEQFTTFTHADRFTFKLNGETHREKKTFIVSKGFFDVFAFEFLEGNGSSVFQSPGSVVLSASKAKELFGTTEVLGKIIESQNYQRENYKITGVISDPVSTSHIRPDIIAYRNDKWYQTDGWTELLFYHYVLLATGVEQEKAQETLDQFSERHLSEPFKQTFDGTGRLFLQPLTAIHLHSDLSFEIEANGKARNVRIIGAIGVFLLLVVSINYMNLATSKATKRIKEMGIRSMLGSNKKMLRTQYLTESALLTFISLIFALFLAVVLLPYFHLLSGKSIEIAQLLDVKLLGAFTVVVLLVGIMGGSYPGFFLSRFATADIFRKRVSLGNRHIPVGKVLNALQFTVALTAITLSITAYHQLQYMKHYDLGFEQEQIMKVQTGNRLDPQKYETVRTELLKFPSVGGVAATMKSPGEDIHADGLPFEHGDGTFKVLKTEFNTIDEHFVHVLDLELVAGRNIGDLNSDQWGKAVLINETLARSMGNETVDQALGKRVKLPIGSDATIVGVVKDFHIRGLQSEINPLMLVNFVPITTTILVKISPQEMNRSIERIDEVLHEVMGHKNHQISFLDQDFWAQYQEEERQSRMLMIAGSMTILLSIIGLIALVSFTVELKMKEMTIRKVFGANFSHVVGLFVRQYAAAIFLALLIAVPSSIYLGQHWLENFAYRTHVSFWVIVTTSVALVFLIFLIIWGQSRRSFHLNPTDQLSAD
ncbi:MAG: FtsX-like permease family protein [Bacteroidota bacterium]